MSFDLEVATVTRPDNDLLNSFRARNPSLLINGAFGAKGNVLVSMPVGGSVGPAFTIDGPLAARADDLADPLADAVPDAAWLLQISVPADTDPDARALALALARDAARRYAGAVYDPQADRVLGRAAKAGPEAKLRLRVVNLLWCFPADRRGELGGPLVRVLDEVYAKALPTRYGETEPLQNEFTPGDEDGFAVWWRAAARSGSPLVAWKATPPCFGGDAALTLPARDQAMAVTPLSLRFDGRAVESDASTRAAVVRLFVDVASRLGAIYGAGYVERNVVLGANGRLGYDAESESLPLGRLIWEGIPAIPTWLAWFGAPYRNALGDEVRRSASESKAEGLLVRVADEPVGADQARLHFPKLPKALVSLGPGRRAERIPSF